MVEKVYFLGIDGGGTGCRARLMDCDGAVCGEGRAGPGSVRLGVDAAWIATMNAANEALRAAQISLADAKIYSGVALAGISRKGALAELKSKTHPYAAVVFVSDSHAACVGAHQGADGGIVIAGTGSIAFALHGGQAIRLGGYGIPVSDEGGGADIGIAALALALRTLDGRAPRCVLSEAVLARFDHDLAGIIAWMDGASGTDYATLAPLVLDCADAGVASADSILRMAGENIGGLIDALAARGISRIALLGGLAQRLAPWIPEQAQHSLTPAHGDAMDGAIHLARSLWNNGN